VLQGVHGAIVAAGANADGIDASNTGGGAGDVTVGTTAAPIAGTIAASGNGVFATSNSTGKVEVDTAAGSTIWAGIDGIEATQTAVGGKVIVNNLGVITQAGSIGIDAEVTDEASAATVQVTTNSISAYGDAVFAQAKGAGVVTVTTFAGSTVGGGLGGAGDGIHALASGGGVTVNAAGNSTVATPSSGWAIAAMDTGGGAVSVTNTGKVLDGGLAAQSTLAGTTTVTVQAGVTNTGGLGVLAISDTGADQLSVSGVGVSGSQGGLAAMTQSGAITISTDVGATIASSGGDGVNAQTVDGAITIDANGTVDAAVNGIVAITSANGGGVVDVTTGNPPLTGQNAVVGSTGVGILVQAGDGANIVADTTVSGGQAGVIVTSGSGPVSVSVNNAVFGGLVGIQASTSGAGAAGMLTVNATSGMINGVNTAANVISPDGSAIVTSSGGNAAINITGSSAAPNMVAGLGTSSTTAVIDIAQAAGATTTIDNSAYSTIRSIGGQYDDLAVHASGATGSVSLVNAGLLLGDIDLGGLAGADSGATVTNTGTWRTSGADSFGAGQGADTLTNGGYLGTSGATTTITFGAASANTLTNTGTIAVGEATTGSPAAYASVLVINNLQTLDNSGTIDMQDGAATPDRALTAAGAAFVGSGASKLVIDVALGGAGSTADTLNVGSTSGSTSIVAQDVKAGLGGNTGPAGITLVTTTGLNGATAFTLDPASSDYTTVSGQSVLKKGLWLYSLENRPTASVLVSTPGVEAFQFTPLATAAQQIWSMSAAWQDRQDDLRDDSFPVAAAHNIELADADDSSLPLAARAPTFEPGVWLKAVGDWSNRTDHVSPMAGFNYDVGYRQTDLGMIGGVDATRHGLFGRDDVLLGGVSLGYIHSNVDFDASSNTAAYAGWTMGIYGAYLRDRFFVDGQVNGDMLNLTVDEPSLAYTGKTQANSWGGQLSAGLRYPLGGGVLEPSATVAYVRTEIGDLAVTGTTVHSGDNDSLRGALGLRYSSVVASNDQMTVKLSGEAKLWNEFDGDNHVTLLSDGPALNMSDNFRGAFGEVGGGVSLFGADGHASAFVNASVKFKGDYLDGGARLGVRYQW
jgi:outer membrane autotransporter protein